MKHFKYFLAFAVAWMAGVISSFAAVDDTFTANTTEGVAVTYKVLTEDGTTGTVQIGLGTSNSPAIATSTTALTIPATVINGDITYNVTAVANYAFNGCTSLSQLTIEDSNETLTMGYGQSVTSGTGRGLFRDCPLTTVYVGRNLSYDTATKQGHSPFALITTINSFTFGDAVTAIRAQFLRGSTGLTEIVVPNQVQSIGKSAFIQCTSLTSVSLPNSLTSLSSYVFYGCTALPSIELPAGVTTIQEYTFYGCTSLLSVTLSSGLTTIGEQSFRNCTSLEAITLPSTLTAIGERAFDGCTALTSIHIPDAVTEIGGSAFSGCTSLTELTLTENSQLATIGSYAFAGCNKLTSIYLPPSLTLVESSAFNATQLSQVNIFDIAAWCSIDFKDERANPMNCWSNTSGVITVYADLYLNGTKVEDLEFPNDVTSIGNFAFYGCKSLKSVAIPASITTIGDKVFALCANLTTLTFAEDNQLTSIGLQFVEASGITEISWPRNLTTIGPNVFYGANKLQTVHIPNTVTAIDDYAFYGCTNLKSVDIPSGITSIGRSAFYLCKSLRTVFCNPQTAPALGSEAWSTGEINYSYVLGYTRQRLLVYPYGSNYSTWEGVYSNNHNWYFYVGEHFIVDGCLYQTHGYYDQVVLKAVSSEAIHNGVVSIPEYVSYGDKSYYVKWILEGAFEENGSNIERLYVNTNTPPELLKDGLAGLSETCDIYVPSSSVNSYESSWGERDYKTFLSKYAEFTVPVSVTNNGTTSQVDMEFKVTSAGINPTVQVGDGSNSSINSSTAGEIVIPSTVTYEGETFTVTSLSQYAFKSCNNIKKMTIPSTITEIKNYAVGCSSLERLYLESSDPTAITVSAPISSISSNCILVVPVGSKAAYQDSVWSDLFQYIKEVGHEEEWLPGDMFLVGVELGNDCWQEIPFKILTSANGDTPGTVQIGSRNYDNTENLDEDGPIPSVFYNFYNSYTPITIPESVEFYGATYTITTIGAYAFSYIDRCEKLVLPSAITTIGYHAFEHGSVANLYVNTDEPATLIADGDGDSPFNWYFYEGADVDGCTLFVPEGYTAAYASWAPYFKNVVEKPRPVVIAGVEYKRETDIFGDGTAVISWEFEENGGIKKAPRKANTKGGSEDDEYAEYLYNEGVPVLTLNNATINYAGNGPFIEVNSFPKFYVRVKGNNSIIVSNAAAAISIGTNKGVDMSPTSLIFLSDDVPANQGGGFSGGGDIGGGELSAPRRRAPGNAANQLPSLTITNNTEGNDGVYVYNGSFNVKDCDVQITANKYGLEFGFYETGGEGPVAPTVKRQAPHRMAKNGPKKVVTPNGPVEAGEYSGWLNIFEGSGLTLNGNAAALWGATGRQIDDYEYEVGYLQYVSLLDSDKSTYERDGYNVYGPFFCSASVGEAESLGSYYFWVADAQDEDNGTPENAKYLKFGCDYFIATTEEGIRMKFKVTDEDDNTCQVGDFNEQTGPITAVDPDNTYGSVTIPSEINGYTVTRICDDAFYYCQNMTGVSIPASVTSIGVMAFGYCSELSTVICNATTPPTLETEVDAGNNILAPFNKDGMTLYVPAEAVEAYQDENLLWKDYFTIKPIGSEGYVFAANTPEGVRLNYMVIDVDEVTNQSLVQVGTGQGSSVVSTPDNWSGQLTVPATVTDGNGKEYIVKGLEAYSLYQWDDLKLVTISEGIEYIGTNSYDWGAFEADNSLETVYLPSSTASLANYCFGSCPQIKEVYLYATVPPELSDYVFSNIYNSATLYVPEGYAETYEDSPWSSWFNNIVEMEDQSVLFTIQTTQGDNVVPMTFKITGENTVQTYGTIRKVYNSDYEDYEYIPEPAIPANTEGSITIPATVEHEGVTYTVTSIGKNSFTSCAITGVTIPASVTYIGSEAFAGAHLNCVTVLNENPQATELSYNTRYEEYDAFYAPEHCKLFVPVGTLDAYQASESWSQCFRLIREVGDTSIGIGDIFYADNAQGEEMCFMITDFDDHKVKTYGYWAGDYAVTAIRSDFSGTLSIPETVTYDGVTYTVTAIGDESFDAYNLELALTEVTIPSTVSSVGYYAFDCCSSITKIYVYATNPPALAEYGPMNVDENAILYVPKGTRTAYVDSNWKLYFSNDESYACERIVEMGGEDDVPVGDINGDEVVTIADVTALVNIILGKPGAVSSSAADINGDGSVTIADVTSLVNIILGKNP